MFTIFPRSIFVLVYEGRMIAVSTWKLLEFCRVLVSNDASQANATAFNIKWNLTLKS